MKELLGFIFSLFLCVFVFAFCHIFSVLFFSSVVFVSFFFFFFASRRLSNEEDERDYFL